MINKFIDFLLTGLYFGKIKYMPGTFGTLVAIPIYYYLLTNNLFLNTTGVIIIGIDIEDLIALIKLPELCTISLPVIRSVATAANGIILSSIFLLPKSFTTVFDNNFIPLNNPINLKEKS